MVDFAILNRQAEASLPTAPRDLCEQLPKNASGYGYLRVVQAQVLTNWDLRRRERDLVIKVNTGGGKTIDERAKGQS